MTAPPSTWVGAILAALFILYLLDSKRRIRKSQLGQHHRLQLADAKALMQEKELANSKRELADFRKESEADKNVLQSKLRILQSQNDAFEEKNRTLLAVQDRNRERFSTLKKQLTEALQENKRLTNPDSEVARLTLLLDTQRREKVEADNLHQEHAKRLFGLQEEMGKALQKFMTNVLPVAQRIAELTSGREVTIVNASPWQQANVLGNTFKMQIMPAIDVLAGKSKGAENKTIYTQYQQSTFYQVAKMDGHDFLCLHPYLPVRYQVTAVEQAARNLIFSFKDGVNTVQVADTIAIAILRSFSAQELSEMVLVIVPASTKTKNESRFLRFCEIVCVKTGLINGYNAIKPLSDREAFKGQTGVNKTANLIYDPVFITRRKILLFDDVMTTGASFKQNSQLLIQNGAQQVTGLFLARTVNR